MWCLHRQEHEYFSPFVKCFQFSTYQEEQIGWPFRDVQGAKPLAMCALEQWFPSAYISPFLQISSSNLHDRAVEERLATGDCVIPYPWPESLLSLAWGLSRLDHFLTPASTCGFYLYGCVSFRGDAPLTWPCQMPELCCRWVKKKAFPDAAVYSDSSCTAHCSAFSVRQKKAESEDNIYSSYQWEKEWGALQKISSPDIICIHIWVWFFGDLPILSPFPLPRISAV